jgi:hypothetical protein
MIRFLFIYLLFFFILFGNFIIGEFIARKLPKTSFSKWWKKNIIGEDKECD